MNRTAYIDPKKCDRSPACPPMRRCPFQAISQEKGDHNYGVSVVDPKLCTGCELCLDYCPQGAIKIIR
ncbi:MAG: ATP-binding protein [Desulfitobacteriia bacterium]|jgi:Fe-S-cluster-containing hydrogenase component 2